jgi:hypothetical protein
MKIKLSTVYGSHEKYDVEITKVALDTENLDEREALANGWLLSNDKWYFSRSVRVNLNKASTKLPLIKGISFGIEPYSAEAFNDIYNTYIKYKGFTKRYDYAADFHRSSWLVVRDEGEMVAFTKLVRYTGGMESAFTAWTYHKPKLSIGTNILYYEMDQARQAGLDYLYIGAGYGEGSKYKSMIDGFEWWTGEEWSTDRKQYLDLCESDANINTLYDLSKIMNA